MIVERSSDIWDGRKEKKVSKSDFFAWFIYSII